MRAAERSSCLAGALLLASTFAATAQQPIGSVSTQDASVAGALEVTAGRAMLVGSSSVTARDHTADVTLQRGGTVRICQTSGVKLSSGSASGATGSVAGSPPLMLALDRGAIEVRMQASAGDAILTPDLRFAVRGAGTIDLRLRVTGNGDTCVEQRSPSAPTLIITDTFAESTYEVHAGQHVLFEHGSLREVVDHETSPCGCPEPQRTMSLAEAALRPPGDAQSPAEQAAGQHPFPAAVSTGLAGGPEVPQAAPGVVHTQAAATLGYEGAQASAPSTLVSAPSSIPPSKAAEPHGFRHSVGSFFHRLFGGSS